MSHLLVLPKPYVLYQLVTNNRKVSSEPLPKHKTTRLVKTFPLRRRNPISSKIHCCYIITSTELKEKHTLEQDVLFVVQSLALGLKKVSLRKNGLLS